MHSGPVPDFGAAVCPSGGTVLITTCSHDAQEGSLIVLQA
jgi:hypothetical protein